MQAVRHTRSEGRRGSSRMGGSRLLCGSLLDGGCLGCRLGGRSCTGRVVVSRSAGCRGAFGGLLRSSGFFRGGLFLCDELDDRGKFTVAGVGQDLVPCVGALGCGFGRTGYVRRLGNDGHRAEHIEYGDGRDRNCNGNTHPDCRSDAGNQFFLHRITPVSEDRVEMTDDKDTIPEKGNQ